MEDRPRISQGLDMLEFFERQRDWSYMTFGPPSFKGPRGPLDHLAKEVVEARNEPDPEKQKEEIIDCLFLVFDAAHRAGMSYAEMGRVAMAKLRKNMARTWPDWRGTDPDKAIEHVRNKDKLTVSCGECNVLYPYADLTERGELYCETCRASRTPAQRKAGQ